MAIFRKNTMSNFAPNFCYSCKPLHDSRDVDLNPLAKYMFKPNNKDIITISMDTVVTMFVFEHVFVQRSKLSSFTK